jgi:phosphatidylglycerol:prolipoprotein diacylglycerol transferase
MWQDIIKIPLPFMSSPLTIHGFGLMLVIGLFVAMYVAKTLARRNGLNPEDFANAAILGLFSGIIGARLSHVLENLAEFTRPERGFFGNLMEVFNVPSGGLTYYGGFLLAFPTLVIYARMKKIPIRLGMDIVAPCLMIGLGFGRLGCFLNGCCYGAECTLPWAMTFPYHSYAYQEQFEKNEVMPPDELLYATTDNKIALQPPERIETRAKTEGDALLKLMREQRSRPVHPAQLYSAFTALLLAAICIVYLPQRRFDGEVFAMMMILESIGRFLLEIVRAEPVVLKIGPYGMSFSMVLSVVLLIGGMVLWAGFAKKRVRAPSGITVRTSM